MRLLMISGDRSVLAGKRGAFWYTLEELRKHWERIDVICPGKNQRNQKSQKNQRNDANAAAEDVGQSSSESSDSSDSSESFFNNVFFHPSPHSLWHQSGWIRTCGRRLIEEHHHDVMTVHEFPPFYTGFGASRLQYETGIPTVAEIHHIVGHPHAGSISEWIGYWMSKWYLPSAVRSAAATRVVNAATKQVLLSWGAPAEKIRIVASFYLDASVFSPIASAEKKHDLIFCARLVANKGLPSVLRAVVSLPGVTLLVIGDGPERASNEQLAQSLGIADRVTFVGWLSDNAAVADVLRSGKIFLMNSLSEGGPRAALEAMACGLPVIATRVGVMPDVIHDGQNGLFTTGQPQDLAQKIGQLLGGEIDRKRMGDAAARITERFERKRLIRKYAEFLQSVAKSAP